MRVLRRPELEDIVIGSALLGAGGGGSLAQGMKLVDYVLSLGPEVKLVDPEEVDPEGYAAVVGGMGSPVAALEKGIFYAHVRAFEALEQATATTIDYILPLEIGGGNSIGPMTVAALKGRPMVDADGAGRAIPELQLTTYAIGGIPISPFTIANEEDVSVVIHARDAYGCERVARAVSTEFGMVAGFAAHLMRGADVARVAVSGSLTLAERTGRAIREARQKGTDPAGAVLAAVEGFVLGRGRVAEVRSETRGGFDFGSVLVEDGDGPALRVDFKNENLIAWRGDRPVAIAPDLVCWLEDGGMPLTNADVREGQRVTVLGFPAHSRWQTPRARDAFSELLTRMGFEGSYRPIRDLAEGR